MKKYYYLALLLAFALNNIQAQGKGQFEFGSNLGYNMSELVIDSYNTNSKSTFNIGASIDYYYSDSWSLKTKVIYDKKGSDETDYIGAISLDYLTFPVNVSWHFGRRKNWYLHFGPAVSFLLKAKNESLNIDLKEDFKNSDFGINLGIGVKIPLSDKLKLFFEYDGFSSLANVYKNSYNNSYENTKILNSRSSLNIGVNFLMN